MRRQILRFALALTAIAVLDAQQPLIWFAPLDPIIRPEVGYGGSGQYMQLFTPDAPWAQAAARVNVFKIYPQWISQASDADLQQQFADLRRRGIALALEWGMLTPSDTCGRGVEGFGGQSTQSAVRRIQRLGGDLRYIAMDEPIFFGTLYNGANACRWTVDQMAQNAAVNIAALHAEFPAIAVGDIEPLPVDETNKDWLNQYGRGMDALHTAIGVPIAFMHSDLLWASNQWLPGLSSFRQAVKSRGIPFGVIYNGDDSNQSDPAWINAAEAHMTGYEESAGPPDHVIFQSWNAFPKSLLPETVAATFTNLIDRYFRARTQLTSIATVHRDTISGGLFANGVPVAGAMLHASAAPLTGSGSESEYVSEGIIPAGIREIVFGIRVNLECGCSAASDFRVRRFVLQSGVVSIVRDFSQGLAGWNASDPTAATIEDGQLHIKTSADQALLINSAPIDFMLEGKPFKLTVTGAVSPVSVGSGYFAAIFLADKELTRARIAISALDLDLGSVTTNSHGQFELAIPPLAPADYRLWIEFAGNQDLWPAKTEIKALKPRRFSRSIE